MRILSIVLDIVEANFNEIFKSWLFGHDDFIKLQSSDLDCPVFYMGEIPFTTEIDDAGNQNDVFHLDLFFGDLSQFEWLPRERLPIINQMFSVKNRLIALLREHDDVKEFKLVKGKAVFNVFDANLDGISLRCDVKLTDRFDYNDC